jgi:hypothetical protein
MPHKIEFFHVTNVAVKWEIKLPSPIRGFFVLQHSRFSPNINRSKEERKIKGCEG